MPSARLEEDKNSCMITLRVEGSPCPPYSSGIERPIQPPAAKASYASLNPLGVVTEPSGWRVQPSWSPDRFRGAKMSSQSLAPSPRIASTRSGVASAKPGRLLWRSMGNTSLKRNITSSTGAL
jgi:hypothetical protein